jgi:hypothetical protein
MANKKINELVTRTPSLSDLILVGDPSSGYSYKATVTALATIIETDIADGFVTLSTTQTISGAKTFSNNLTLTSVANAATTQTKFLTLNASNVVNYRTGAEVLADIGGQGTLTLTTTGTSGAATLVGNTLNIPQYQSTLTNPVTGTGTTNYLPKFTGSTTIGNSQLIDDGTTVFLGTSGTLPNVKMIISTTSQRALELISTSGNALFVSSGGAFVMTVTNGTWSSQFTQAGRLELGGDLSITTIANATVDTDKFLVSDSGVLKYRTGAEVLSDIGGASSASISGTTNYIPKFTSSSAIGNSVIYEASGSIGINSTSPTVISGFTTLSVNNATQGGMFETMYNGTPYGRFFAAGGAGYVGLLSVANVPLLFGVNDTEQMRLTSTGLGIGTSSPAYKLDVNGVGRFQSANYPQILFTETTTNTNSVIYYDNVSATKALIFRVSDATDRMFLNASGNLGLGVTPSAWNSVYKAINIGLKGFIYSRTDNEETSFGVNWYRDAAGGYVYATNGTAQYYTQSSGSHYWLTAPSGTAGNAITFTQAMTLDASGNLVLGTTASLSSSANRVDLTINGSSSSMLTYGVNGTRRAYLISNGTDLTLSNTVSGATIFSTNDTERMRITSGGNVGIGVSSPNTQLQINGTPSNDWGNLTLFDTRSQAADRGGMISFGGYKSTTSTEALFAQIKGNKENGTSGNEAGYLAFFTNNNTTYAERMRITSVGEVYIAGTTDQGAYNLQVNGTGVWGAGAYVNGSDSSLKENIQNMGSALDLVNQLQPKTYTYKPSYSKDSTIQVGFIAQDLEQVLANQNYKGSIVVDGPNFKSVAYQNLIPLLVQSIKELKAEIETLKNK